MRKEKRTKTERKSLDSLLAQLQLGPSVKEPRATGTRLHGTAKGHSEFPTDAGDASHF